MNKQPVPDGWGRNDDDHNGGFFLFGGNDLGDFDQDADSGDVDQSFDVSGTGENSNQTWRSGSG